MRGEPAEQVVDALGTRQAREVSRWDELLIDLQVWTEGRMALVTLEFEEFDIEGSFIVFLVGLLSHA